MKDGVPMARRFLFYFSELPLSYKSFAALSPKRQGAVAFSLHVQPIV
ncbi:hypothetical protein [Pseudooceanicola sediminis]|nr:hypothetical protein [Pseudooceanicola sediminis]|tara:strand:- start:36085 stop:36225 length:141 start_codon:yes stop_codon:yes gene_type:complete